MKHIKGGQQENYPIESIYPRVAWGILRQMAGERISPLRHEGGRLVNHEQRKILKRRVTYLVTSAMEKMLHDSNLKMFQSDLVSKLNEEGVTEEDIRQDPVVSSALGLTTD